MAPGYLGNANRLEIDLIDFARKYNRKLNRLEIDLGAPPLFTGINFRGAAKPAPRPPPTRGKYPGGGAVAQRRCATAPLTQVDEVARWRNDISLMRFSRMD